MSDSNKSLDAILKPIAAALLLGPAIAALIAASAIWRGYVLSILWIWFIVPAFGLSPLSIPYAIGFALVVSFLTPMPSKGKELDWSNAIAQIAFAPALALLCGWIVTKCI